MCTMADEPLGGASPAVSDSESESPRKEKAAARKRKLSKKSRKSKKKSKKSKVVADSDESDDEKVQ